MLLGTAVARGDDSSSEGPSGHWRLAVTAGVGSANHNTYFLIGGMVGYEMALGFTPNLQGLAWTGSTPSMFKLSPGLTWYAPLPLIRPYVGAFYSHWFVGSGFPDQDAIGLRGGLQLASAGPATIDAGVAYEHLLSCSVDCDSWWPEISAAVRF